MCFNAVEIDMCQTLHKNCSRHTLQARPVTLTYISYTSDFDTRLVVYHFSLNSCNCIYDHIYCLIPDHFNYLK